MAKIMMESKETHEQILNIMATKDFTSDIVALLKIRAPIVYLTCAEEKRVLLYFQHMSVSRGFRGYTWDCHMGVLDLFTGDKAKHITSDNRMPEMVLDAIIEDAESDQKNQEALVGSGINGKIYILLDFFRFLDDAGIERRLKRFAMIKSMTTIIITAPMLVTTPALENTFSVIDFPYPNKDEIEAAIETLCTTPNVKKDLPHLENEAKKNLHEIVGSVSGLTLCEASSALSKAIVKHHAFHIPAILAEKKLFIRRKGILEFCEPKVTMKDVGGLQSMVRWFERRKVSLEPGAAAYGLPPVKGVMLMGIPGAGKSLVAKAVASMYRLPLLRLDFGSLFQSHVGESEERSRMVLKLADACSPCMLWIDEVEKGISGTASSGYTDGGTTDRVVSTFLTWMQEHETTVIVLCTANDNEKIPPAFMRAGRFDEVFFVDFPNQTERKHIFQVLLRKYSRDPENFNIPQLAAKAHNYTGAEIEKSITSALFESYSDGARELKTDDILTALGTFNPQYNMRPEYFNNMKKWAHDRGYVMASDPEVADTNSIGIDLSK
jgi:ATP-dependent 26S proteasome regulatory subunit